MITGSCLCSAVKYEIEGAFQEAHHCQCSRCRRVSGAAFSTFGCAQVANFRIVAGAEEVTPYRSRAVRRSFCRACGSSLFFEHDNGNAPSTGEGRRVCERLA